MIRFPAGGQKDSSGREERGKGGERETLRSESASESQAAAASPSSSGLLRKMWVTKTHSSWKKRKTVRKAPRQTGDVEGVGALHDFAPKAAGRREGEREERTKTLQGSEVAAAGPSPQIRHPSILGKK